MKGSDWVLSIHIMTEELKKCECEILDSLIKHTDDTDEARGLLQKILGELDGHSKLVRDE